MTEGILWRIIYTGRPVTLKSYAIYFLSQMGDWCHSATTIYLNNYKLFLFQCLRRIVAYDIRGHSVAYSLYRQACNDQELCLGFHALKGHWGYSATIVYVSNYEVFLSHCLGYIIAYDSMRHSGVCV